MTHAYHFTILSSPPENWGEISAAISGHFCRLFGVTARKGILYGLNSLFNGADPAFLTAGLIQQEGQMGALWVSKENHGFHEVNLLHADPALPSEAASALVTPVTALLRNRGVKGILLDTPCTGPEIWRNAFLNEGFHVMERSLYHAAIPLLPSDEENTEIRLIRDMKEIDRLAACMVQSYQASEDRVLHPEMHDLAFAQPHLYRSWKSGGILLGLWRGDECIAGLCAETPAPNHAFLMHLFVHPEQRRQGYATRLMARLKRLADTRWNAKILWLCVSDSNPARHLYQRIGFTPYQQQQAYYWYEPEYRETHNLPPVSWGETP